MESVIIIIGVDLSGFVVSGPSQILAGREKHRHKWGTCCKCCCKDSIYTRNLETYGQFGQQDDCYRIQVCNWKDYLNITDLFLIYGGMKYMQTIKLNIIWINVNKQVLLLLGLNNDQ